MSKKGAEKITPPKKEERKTNYATSSNLYWSYYLHRSRELVSPECRICLLIVSLCLISLFSQAFLLQQTYRTESTTAWLWPSVACSEDESVLLWTKGMASSSSSSSLSSSSLSSSSSWRIHNFPNTQIPSKLYSRRGHQRTASNWSTASAVRSLDSQHFTLYTLHFTLYTLHFTLYTLHFTLYTLHSTLYTLHFTLYTLHYTLYTLHFTLYTLHCTLCRKKTQFHLTVLTKLFQEENHHLQWEKGLSHSTSEVWSVWKPILFNNKGLITKNDNG